ncbi:signal peptidase I [Paenibacillus filicis]|uniref:Signal peptidase I n=1 Tax=Paenibacillus filicis TaxID=669464 RepID=A0ABU9DUI5_9BACL
MSILILVLMLTFPGLADEFSYKHYVAQGPAMLPTIASEDRLTVDPDYYSTHPFQRGDILVFKLSDDRIFIKRVIGFPGEKIRIQEHRLYIDGVAREEPYLQSQLADSLRLNAGAPFDYPEQIVPEDTIFVLGDNRLNSLDSRTFGAVDIGHVLGKVIRINPRESSSPPH